MELVITLEYFEDNTVIDTDFDIDKALNHLNDAHDVQLNELLGDELYKRLQDSILPTPSAGLETDLVNLLKMFVVKATEVNLVPFLNTPVSAKGTQERSGDFSTSAGQPDKALRLDNIRAKEEVFAGKVRTFLTDNIQEFPEYKCKLGGTGFYSPIHFF